MSKKERNERNERNEFLKVMRKMIASIPDAHLELPNEKDWVESYAKSMEGLKKLILKNCKEA
jgi:hypothetical protein